MALDERVFFGLVLATGVVIPGVADYLISSLFGYHLVGGIVWAIGYLAMAAFVWYRWIRPLDFTDPTG